MRPRRALLDANVLIAALNRRDQYHAQAMQLLAVDQMLLVTCWPAITEATHMLRSVSQGVDTLLRLCESAPRIAIVEIKREELHAIRAWMRKYHAMKPDFADACLIYLAERHKLDSILSFDDDFDTYRTTSGRAVKRLHAQGF